MDSLGLTLDFALEMLSGSHAQKKKKTKGLGGVRNFLPLMLCQEKKEEQRIPTGFLRTSLFSSFAAPESAVLAQNGRGEAGYCLALVTWLVPYQTGRKLPHLRSTRPTVGTDAGLKVTSNSCRGFIRKCTLIPSLRVRSDWPSQNQIRGQDTV